MNKIFEILNKYYGYNSFRKGQYEIISNILRGRDSFCILPTGAGKSICYQIPALMFNGITIVISPLISLMKDQVDNLNSNGINARYINSTQKLEVSDEIIELCKKGEVKLLYIAPEKLENEFYYIKLENKTNVEINLSEGSKDYSLKGKYILAVLEKLNQCTDDYEKEIVSLALKLGIQCFTDEEVTVDDN